MLFVSLVLAVQAAAAAPADKPDKKICRSDHVVGSRIPSRRVCRTRAEWAREAQSMDPAARLQMEQSMGLSGRLMNPGGGS